MRKGVPALLRLLDEYQIKASFCISLGPDSSVYPFGKSLPGWIRKRLPAPYIGHNQRDLLLAIESAGHDVGLASYSPLEWRINSAFQSPEWVRKEIAQAVDSFIDLMDRAPRFYGALDFQTNASLFNEEESIGLDFASDVRGRNAFLPELQGVQSSCPQIPTTLPKLDELLLEPDINHENLHQFLYAECQRVLPNGEIFTLSAEREGGELISVFEKLLIMWKGGQWEIRSLSDLLEQIDVSQLKYHSIGWKQVVGTGQFVAMQSSPAE
ncbi:MAG: deacylase [Sedimenticola sp.]|nr:deacylase [Sedimenticola sp.]